MTITLTPEQSEIVIDKVARGEYPNPEAVMEKALYLLKCQDVPDPYPIEPE